jgi:hypothetical protein
MVYENFIECVSVEMANKVDMELYRFERFSESRGYIFARRKGK